MRTSISRTGFLVLAVVVFLGCAGSGASTASNGDIPAWARDGKHPGYASGLYWTGVGSGTDLPGATDVARAQVASQIRVQVKSVTTSTQAEFTEEDASTFKSSFESTVQSLVDETIQGIEIVETASAGGKYFAYAVLNKMTYLNALRQELEDYVDQLNSLYNDANRLLEQGEIFPAIENLNDAVALAPEVYPRANFYNALAAAPFSMPDYLQGKALLSHVRTILSGITLSLESGEDQVAAPGQRLPKPVVVKVTLGHGSKRIGIPDMPLRVVYASGDRAAKPTTDADGEVEILVSAVAGDRADAGYVRITPNLGRLPENMAASMSNLELQVPYAIAGEAAAFAVVVKDDRGNRLSKVEDDLGRLVVQAGFRVDPQANLQLQGLVSLENVREINVGGSPTYQAEASLRLSVYDVSSKATLGSLEADKKTVNKDKTKAQQAILNQVGKAVKRRELTEMLADALAK